MSPLDALGFAPMVPDMERIETALRASVRAEDPFLSDVAGHLISAGGKRLRPALAVCAAYAAKGLGPAADDAVTGGVAVELVHLGSLYHDDVIDEAETRRGVPSVNARWSNIVAILAGDYLLARASSLAASLGADVAALLAATIGELCRGQVLELQRIIFDLKRSNIGILITDHAVRETLVVTDRAYIINNGRIFRAGSPEALERDPEVKRIYLGESFSLRV